MDERGIGAVLVISEIAKRLGAPARVLPLINLLLGVIWQVIMGTEPSMPQKVLTGAVIGASAGGTWDAGKSIVVGATNLVRRNGTSGPDGAAVTP